MISVLVSLLRCSLASKYRQTKRFFRFLACAQWASRSPMFGHQKGAIDYWNAHTISQRFRVPFILDSFFRVVQNVAFGSAEINGQRRRGFSRLGNSAKKMAKRFSYTKKTFLEFAAGVFSSLFVFCFIPWPRHSQSKDTIKRAIKKHLWNATHASFFCLSGRPVTQSLGCKL